MATTPVTITQQVSPDPSMTTGPHHIIPLNTPVLYRTSGSTRAGIVVSIPADTIRPFYTVIDNRDQELVDVTPSNVTIWLNHVPAASVTPDATPTPTTTTPDYGEEKDKRSKRSKLELNTLPFNRDSCMTFHDSVWIQLARYEWDTPHGQHLLEHGSTELEIKKLSSDLFFSLSQGKTSTGTLATDAFPILKDPLYINQGVECYWKIFEEFCPLADHELPNLLREFNCLLQHSKESPQGFRSRLNVYRGWLTRAGLHKSDSDCVLQHAIGLQNGAYREAYVDLWKEFKRGRLSYQSTTLDTLVTEATIHIASNQRFCPEPGVYLPVAPPPSLRPTGTAAAPKARLAGKEKESEPPTGTAPSATDPQHVIDTLMSVSRCSDAAAKRILHTFRCPYHLIPWRGATTTDHFLNDCPTIADKY